MSFGEAALLHYSNENLGDYLSGALSAKDEADCERHLASCDKCRGQLAFLFRIAEDYVAPAEAAIIDSIEATGLRAFPPRREPVKLTEKLQWWIFPRWQLAALSVCLVLLAGAAAVWWSGSPEPLRLASIERSFEARTAAQPYSEFVPKRVQSRVEEGRSGQSELARLRASNADIGRFYLASNNFDQAVSYLETARKEQPSSSEVHNDLGVAYMESGAEGALQKALQEFEEALRLTPKYEPALFNMALAYERLGQFPESEHRLRLYLQVDPDSGWAKEVKSKLQASER
jgi:tetratricopeptide (TPR) repeat protein